MARASPPTGPAASPPTAGDLVVLADGTEWAVLGESGDEPSRFELRDLRRGCTYTRDRFDVERALSSGGRIVRDGARRFGPEATARS